MRVQPMDELITLLSKQAEQIEKLESHAATLAHDPQQIQRYRCILEEKARLLSGLAHLSQPITKKMPPEKATPVQHMLNRFSQSATTSMRIGSPFYMSALLYPQDHQPGQPNDLQLFIQQLKEQE
ncbi:hypothetical protein [Halodesulfovibrio marinisediminis]|uniref:FlgN protein n=1 Tax=Halodesulfovibrio marinisediminis DSM 17456 TaxID=1121457 RepID=A0A1N6IEX1_9BACT|nr:hypothetical protein [Halodesulfovibrio marinisediminis]SIO30587.1 hypothetical protein SAMN02745161_2683 [Halodesulfovibrio marinisediminis DSM 17456]